MSARTPLPHWKRLLFALGIVGLVAASAGSRSAAAQEARYPAWFHSMPEPETDRSRGALWAVGYARGYSALSAGMDSARADAYERLRRNLRAVLRGEKVYESAPGFQMSFEGARFTETGLPDTLRSVAYVDSLTAGGMTLVLATWTPTGSPPSGPPPGARAPFPETPPSWVRGGAPADGNRARAVGRAPRYYYLENSWRRAEKRARRRLAFQAASKIERLEKTAEGWRHGVTSMQTEVRLRRVQAIARWGNEETCYVLVEGTVDEVLIGQD